MEARETINQNIKEVQEPLKMLSEFVEKGQRKIANMSPMAEAIERGLYLDAAEKDKARLESVLADYEAQLEKNTSDLRLAERKLDALVAEQRRKDEQAAFEARMAAERAARLEAEKMAEAKRIADEQRIAAEKAAAEQAAEERRIAREEARAKRQWTLIATVGGMLVALLGLFVALRAFGVSASIAEWSRSFYWLTRAAIVLTFALFFLATIETVFGALTIPDWMRRPLADLLDKASDAIDPEAQADGK